MTLNEISPAEWSETSDKALAEKYGGTRARFSAWRKRHSLPPSPAGHGGARHGEPLKKTLLAKLAKLPLKNLRELVAKFT